MLNIVSSVKAPTLDIIIGKIASTTLEGVKLWGNTKLNFNSIWDVGKQCNDGV